MKRDELILIKAKYLSKAEMFYKNTTSKSVIEWMADFALSLEEETCKWKQPPLCDWYFPLCLDGEPYQIYDNITFDYCPFCGKKIERI